VGAFLCAPGRGNAELRVFADGSVEQCLLAESTDFFGHALMPGTVVNIRADGTPKGAWLPRDQPLDGHVCRGTGAGGWSVDFHPSGRLRGCFLADEEVIQGVPCRKGTFWTEVTGGAYVGFHENGRLERCAAARDVVVGGYAFRARREVRLDADGRVLDPATYRRR
jgi:hypothetical protein